MKAVQPRKLERRIKQNATVRSVPGVKLFYMSHYAKPVTYNNPGSTIIHHGSNNLKMNEPSELIPKYTMEL